MDEDDVQQFSLRWHNHQNSVIGALGRMFSTGTLTDVTLSASGTTVKAHRLVLASCSQYFAQLFKEVEAENNTLVVVLGCDAAELRLLLTFMYTGEVTASKRVLPSLLRLAQTLKVSGLTDTDTGSASAGQGGCGRSTSGTGGCHLMLRRQSSFDEAVKLSATIVNMNSTLTPTESEPPQDETTSPVNLEIKNDIQPQIVNDNSSSSSKLNYDDMLSPTNEKEANFISDYMRKSEKDRLSKLDQIVQNLYSTHKIGNPAATMVTAVPESPEPYDRKWRINTSICTICNKRLSNQYNLRVHMETHAGRRHACRACSHVSRSRDALRKHVAYRHAPQQHRQGRGDM